MAHVLIQFIRAYRPLKAKAGDVRSVSRDEADRLVDGGIANVVGMGNSKINRMMTGKGVKKK